MADNVRPISMTVLARLLVAVVLGGLLVWGISITALGAQGALLREPGLMKAFAMHPDSATQLALSALADKRAGEAVPLARGVVLEDPLNVKALAAMGFALEQSGKENEAKPILRRAASMGWRNTASLVWDLQDAARADDTARVVEIADALARRQEAGVLTQAVFFGSLVEPRMRRVFVQRMAARPAWRQAFFADAQINLKLAQVDGMELVLRELRNTVAPPKPIELLSYVERMVELGLAERAHRYWVTAFAIPPADAAAQPFDGGFRRAAAAPADAPRSAFEWKFDPDLGDVAYFIDEAGGPALRIEPGASDGTVLATQTLLLRPGEHILETRLASGSGAAAPAGWTITCIGSKQPLLRTIEGNRRDELTRIKVTVPTQGCAAQTLQLTGISRLDAQSAVITGVTIR